MPTWSGILELIKQQQQSSGRVDYDRLRREFLTQLYNHTGRETILYATAFVQKSNLLDNASSIVDGDIQDPVNNSV